MTKARRWHSDVINPVLGGARRIADPGRPARRMKAMSPAISAGSRLMAGFGLSRERVRVFFRRVRQPMPIIVNGALALKIALPRVAVDDHLNMRRGTPSPTY